MRSGSVRGLRGEDQAEAVSGADSQIRASPNTRRWLHNGGGLMDGWSLVVGYLLGAILAYAFMAWRVSKYR